MTIRVLVIIVALCSLGGVAYASIPDGNGVIHGCYKNSTGMLKVIDSASQSCAGTETALNWNQAGPTGARGPTGSRGATGPQGAAGISLWAFVNTNGTLARGSHAVSSSQTSTGVYSVTFDQNVSGCVWVASLNEDRGEVVTSSSSSVVTVQTFTHASNGASANAFSLVVAC